MAVKMIGGLKLDRKAKTILSNRIGLVREARLAGESRHPNIVEVYDIGQQEGNLYVVMEYLKGVPLDRLIRRRRVGLSEGYVSLHKCATPLIAAESFTAT